MIVLTFLARGLCIAVLLATVFLLVVTPLSCAFADWREGRVAARRQRAQLRRQAMSRHPAGKGLR